VNPIKLALVRRRFSLSGGAENYAVRLAAGLAARGIDVHIVAEKWPEKNAPGPLHQIGETLSPASFADRVAAFLAEHSFDVVFSLERIHGADVYRAGDGVHREWLSRKAGTKHALGRVLDLFNFKQWQILRLEREMFDPARTSRVIANSRRVAAEITRWYPFPAERIEVIYNGVEAARFAAGNRERVRKQFGVAPDEFLLLLVGSGARRKGVPAALQAARLLMERRARILVLGHDSASWCAADGHALYASPTDHPEDFYAAADVFLLPSLYEPFSNACLEALAAGLPVVTSQPNGAAEILERDIGAVLHDPADPRAIASAVAPFLDRARLAAVKPLAQAKAAEFSLDRNVEQTLKIIRQTAETRKKNGLK